MDSKYGSAFGGWCSSEPIRVYKVSFRRGWGKFCSHTKFEVGDGSKVKFNVIIGVGIQPLRTPF